MVGYLTAAWPSVYRRHTKTKSPRTAATGQASAQPVGLFPRTPYHLIAWD